MTAPTCPTPAKHRYATREAAVRDAEKLRRIRGRDLNPYRCKCGFVHLTSLAPPERYQTTKGSADAR